jgi:putative cell wall-binding protein
MLITYKILGIYLKFALLTAFQMLNYDFNSVVAQTVNNVVVAVPQSELKYNTTYTLTVPSGAVQSYTGKPNSAHTTTFRTDQEFTRLGRLDRYETSAQIAAKGWGKSDYAVIANDENFPGALSAAPLAKKHNAPILLTQSDSPW